MLVSTRKDLERRRLTLVSEHEAPIDGVWDLWAGPSRLGEWWVPPGRGFVLDEHDLTPGGRVRFHLDAPDGGRMDARFEVHEVDPPRHLRLDFHSDGIDPVEVEVAVEEVTPTRTRMTVVVSFDSDDALARALDLGVDVGLGASMARADRALGDAGAAPGVVD